MQHESEHQSAMYELNIDEEFQRLHIPMVEKKFKRLEQNIYQRGATKPILIWNGYIVDGHKRYDIFHRRNIPFRVHIVDFSSRNEIMDWLCDKNLLRQDLTDEYRKYFIGKKLLIQYALIKDTDSETLHDNVSQSTTPQNKYLLALQIGQTFSLSYVTVLKYAHYAQAIDSIYRWEPGIAEQILTASVKVSHDNVLLISQLPPDNLKKLRSGFDSGRFDKLMSSQIWHEIKEDHKKAVTQPKKKMDKPKAEIKNMPKYDPDAELLSLTLTIPMWKSSMERVKAVAKLEHTSAAAKDNLINQLSALSRTIDELISHIKEADNEQRNGAESGPICTESTLRTDPDKKSGIEPGVSEESVTEACPESSRQLRHLSDQSG